MENTKFIDTYMDDVQDIVQTISRDDIEKVIQLLYEAWDEDASIFIAGNGGSASTATHFASDLNKWVSSGAPRRFKAFCLADNVPLVSALTNDEGWDNIYSYQLESFLRRGDVLVVISVHGGSGSENAGLWSQNLLKAVRLAKDRECKVVGLIGFDGGLLRKVADASIVVPAASTPQVEGFHLVLTHLVSARLKEAIAGNEHR